MSDTQSSPSHLSLVSPEHSEPAVTTAGTEYSARPGILNSSDLFTEAAPLYARSRPSYAPAHSSTGWPEKQPAVSSLNSVPEPVSDRHFWTRTSAAYLCSRAEPCHAAAPAQAAGFDYAESGCAPSKFWIRLLKRPVSAVNPWTGCSPRRPFTGLIQSVSGQNA